jgi:hypothetical protein
MAAASTQQTPRLRFKSMSLPTTNFNPLPPSLLALLVFPHSIQCNLSACLQLLAQYIHLN